MKASGGLTYVTGPMGSGKSLFGCRKLAAAMMQGQYVITNVKLRPGWAQRIARHTPQAFGSPWAFKKRVRLYESLYVFETSLERATAYRVPGNKESRAVMVWDEAHNDMNNREWMQENNKYVIKWATQLRKLGFAAYLLSQHRDNTDAALRRIANFEVRLRNQREAVRVLGMKVSPIPFFLAIWYPANMPKIVRGDSIIHIERYFLTWHKKLYDTLDLYHGLDEDISDLYDAVIYLPKPGTWQRTAIENAARELEQAGLLEPTEAQKAAAIGYEGQRAVNIVDGPPLTGGAWTRIIDEPNQALPDEAPEQEAI